MKIDICKGYVCVTNFCRWITFKAVVYGPANFIVCFISQVDFRFLSVDFTMVLKYQSMSSPSADEISLATLLFDNLFCYQGIRDFRIPQELYADSLLAKEKVFITSI